MNSGDTAWVLTSSALVLLMTIPGLAFFYGGLVRRKNVLSILMQCLIILCVITLQWVLYGYSLTFGPDAWNGIIGNLDWAGLRNVGGQPNTDYAATIPHYAFMIFQCMFAVITPALIIGTYAERIKFSAFLAFTILWATFVYNPLGHWVWGMGGWLRDLGALDFAGGIVVHTSSGVSALVLALLIGKRIGFEKGHSPRTTCPSPSWAERCSGSAGSGSMRAAPWRPMNSQPPPSSRQRSPPLPPDLHGP